MKITGVKTLHCDAGWRTWSFIKITTDTHHVGWSEVTDSNGSPSGIAGVVGDIRTHLVGRNALEIEAIYWELFSGLRQNIGSTVVKAIAGIENALLDLKGKYYGIPVYELLGGPVRKDIPVYWSHCGTSRVRASQHVNTLPITGSHAKSMVDFCDEVRRSGYNTIKTNIPFFNDHPGIYMPGFGKTPGGPELECSTDIRESAYEWIESLRHYLPHVNIIVDLNYNFKKAGMIKMINSLEDLDITWAEVDTLCPMQLQDIRDSVLVPICSGENLYGIHQFRPFFENNAMDVVSIDVLWNGLIRSLQIASMADTYGLNVTTHNYNSNLSTFINAHFCAMVPNLRIMEYDVDDVYWRDDLCTDKPFIHNGTLRLTDRPGWGADINEVVLSGHTRRL
jgi:galactonate dehydratase